MPVLDDPNHPGGLRNTPLETKRLSDPPQRSKPEPPDTAATRDFGADFSGRNGLAGVLGAVQQLAIEVMQRMFGQMRITGDSNIDVQGSGLNWKLKWRRPVETSSPTITGSGPDATLEAFYGRNANMGGALKVGISAGNINGNVIAAQTITVTVSGEYFVKVTSDASFVETAWEVLNAASTPASSTYIGYNRLGTYTVAAGVLTVTPDVGRPGRFGMVGYKNVTGNEHVWWGDAAP